MIFSPKNAVIAYCSLLLTNFVQAEETGRSLKEQIQTVYHSLSPRTTSSTAARLDEISNRFVGKPYALHSLGDGASSLYDEAPLFRLDAFDCETYVTTVLALTLGRDFEEFKQCLQNIRYKKGKAGYLTRNHFTSADWNINNQNSGYIKDITFAIKDNKQKPVAEMAEAYIDKPSWYAHHTLENIRLAENNPKLQEQRLAELKAKGAKEPRTIARIAYLPLKVLFDGQGEPDMHFFKQIPNGAIIEIVRPNWDLTRQIGTHLNVSHMGFVFWKNQNLLFRQATSLQNKVVEVNLVHYLQQALKSPTIKGINIQVLVPEKPLGCAQSQRCC